MAATNTFDDLIRQRAEQLRAEAARNPVDWNERRTWWLGRITALYEQVEGWFEPLINEQTVMAKRELLDLNEEHIGSYVSEKLVLSLAGVNLKLIPVGTLILGGFGRIDVIGSTGRAMLILAAENDDLPMPSRRNSAQWSLVRAGNRSQLTALTEPVFKELFADLISLSR